MDNYGPLPHMDPHHPYLKLGPKKRFLCLPYEEDCVIESMRTEFLLAPCMGPKMSPRSAMTQRSVQALRAKYFQIVSFAKF